MGNKKIALKVENISIRFNLSKEKVDNLKELIIKKSFFGLLVIIMILI